MTGGPADDLIYFPGLDQDLVLDEADREEADNYGNLSAGIDVVQQLNKGHSLYAGADVNLRVHGEVKALDYTIFALRTGYRYFWANQSIRAGLRASDWQLDGDRYQDSNAFELEWNNTIARRSQVAVAGVLSRYRHRAKDDERLDYDDSRLRFGYTRPLGKQGDRLLGVSLDVGREDDLNDREDGNQDFLGLRLSAQMTLGEEARGFLLINSLKHEYDRVNPLFSEKRSDSQYQLALGVTWLTGKSTSLRTMVVYSDTRSNFELYDSSSTDFSVNLRRGF